MRWWPFKRKVPTSQSSEERQNRINSEHAKAEADIDLKVKNLNESGKLSELDFDSFVETTKVVIEILDALAKIHPVVGVAVTAFSEVLKLDIARRENNKKVRVIQLQMRNMMCALFQLRFRTAPPDSNLPQLMEMIANDIKKCSSDLKYFKDAIFLLKMIRAKDYANRFQDHVNTFSHRRSELQTVLTIEIITGVDDVKAGIEIINTKIDNFVESVQSIFHKLHTSVEKQVFTFFEQHGGANNCIRKDDLLPTLLHLAGDALPPNSGKSFQTEEERLSANRTALLEELALTLDNILDKNFQRFQSFLIIQNNHLKEKMEHVAEKIDGLAGPNSAAELVDLELQRIWRSMGLNSKKIVKAKHFVLTFRDHFDDQTNPPSPDTQTIITPSAESKDPAGRKSTAPENQPSTATMYPEDDSDRWLLEYIDAAHVQPIVEAIDKDGSGFISIKEVNEFALARPKEFDSLLRWIVYWAAGWHINITNYRKKIYTILLQMHEMLPLIHPANRPWVDVYLDSFAMDRIEGLLRSTKGIPENTATQGKLIDLAKSFATIHEQSLETNLKLVSFVISSAADAILVAGSARIEACIYPLLYVVLKFHLAIIGLSKTHVLHTRELQTHTYSLLWIFDVFDERMRRLEAIFSQAANRKVGRQFETFAYGMFYTSYKMDTEIVPAKNTLRTIDVGDYKLDDSNFLDSLSDASDVSELLVMGKEQHLESLPMDSDLSLVDTSQDILTSPEYGSWNYARRRWAFAIEAVRYKRKRILAYWRSCKLFKGHLSHWRMYGYIGYYVTCDVCRNYLAFSRYQCIYCIKEEMDNQLDFCGKDCCILSSPTTNYEHGRSHRPSHTLLRSTQFIHNCDIATMIPQSRLRSERIKSAFAALQTPQSTSQNINMARASDNINSWNIDSERRSLLCLCCKKEVSLPCWVCAVCALDTVICIECEQTRSPVPQGDASSTAHSHNHHLLRIHDAVPVKPEGEDRQLIAQLVESKMEKRISKMEAKVDMKLEEMRSLLQKLVSSTISIQSSQTES